MALRTIGSGMQMDDVVRTVNENFRDIENIFRSIPIKDETGKTRILIGKQPDGTYAIVMTKEGIDILDAYS
jgi:hypothetical protein